MSRQLLVAVFVAMIIVAGLQYWQVEARRRRTPERGQLNRRTTTAQVVRWGINIISLGVPALAIFMVWRGITVATLTLFIVPFVLVIGLTQLTLRTQESIKAKARGLFAKATLRGQKAISSTRGNLIAVIALYAIFFGILILGTPATTISLKNDTNITLEVSTCGSDPNVIEPGTTVSVDTSRNDPKVACTVYNNRGEYLGCLPTPTTTAQRQFTISRLDRRIGPDLCGD